MRAFGQVAQVHGIPPAFAGGHHCARSSKRTVRLISGVALDECLDPERYRTRAPAFVPPAGRDYGSAGHFEPLNAKKLERPAARNEPGIDYTSQCYGMLTWWSHVLVQKRGGELVEETNQGFENF